MSIIINNVSKAFEDSRYALKDVDIQIENGVFGLIGNSDSGKTTLLKMIASLLEPSSGDIELFGKNIKCKSKYDMSQLVGYLPQKFSFYDNYSIEDFLIYMAKMHGLDRKNSKARVIELLKLLGLYDVRELKYYHLTEGMIRRVGLAQAMLNKPKILIVDDPINCLDKEEKRIIKETLNEYGKNNIVIVSARKGSDLEGIVSNLAVMHKGRLRFFGGSDDLIKNASGSVWMSNLGEFLDVSRLKDIHKLVSFDKIGSDFYARVISDVKPYKDSKVVKATLEDAFLYSVYSS